MPSEAVRLKKAAVHPFHEESTRAGERLAVLQVEDSESDAALIQRCLEKAGLQLECKRVETANEMRAALCQQSWDVVIADYHLPQFNAESALATLQSSGCETPFIVVSGAVGEDAAVEIMKRGAHDIVTKGNLSRLGPAVRREISESRTRGQRRRAEEALRKSEHEFRELAESIPQLVWITNGDGETIYCNTRCHELLGVEPGQSLGDRWAELLHAEDCEACLKAWNGSLKTGRKFQRECRFQIAASHYRWFLVRATPVDDHLGESIRWFGTSTDIDDQKQIQEQLIETNAELARSNSMLEQFAYIASHDLREPIRTVAVFVQLLGAKLKNDLDPTVAEYIQSLYDGALRMNHLVDDLLTFSRAGRHDHALVATNVEEVLDEALWNLSARVRETGARITRGTLPVVRADFGQLVQLFQNLIGNALKYRKDDVAPVIDISVEEEQNSWVFAVRDNGIGINPRYFTQIFGIFKRLHAREKYEGTGIGLAVCQRIVERHRGRIWVTSAEGAGATFYFAIPKSVGEGSPAD